jgi:hypothetical protein
LTAPARSDRQRGYRRARRQNRFVSRASQKSRRAARRAGERPERQQDARLVVARASARDGEPLPAGTWVTVVSPVNMEVGGMLMWHPPQPVAFNLIEAKRYRDRGARRRVTIMSKVKRRPDGTVGPENPRAVIDCLSDLQAAVLFAFTALESLANHAIEMLDDDATVVRKGAVIGKAAMTRDLGIDDKFKLVIPQVTGGVRIAGNATTWGRYRALKFLRDELLHVKERGYAPDPNERTAYDRLIMGEGDRCVEDAAATVDGAWPGFLPEHVWDALKLRPANA